MCIDYLSVFSRKVGKGNVARYRLLIIPFLEGGGGECGGVDLSKVSGEIRMELAVISKPSRKDQKSYIYIYKSF